MSHPLLACIPDELLLRTTGPAEAARTRRLHAWLEYRNYRPLLADLEAERARRGHRPAEGTVPPATDERTQP